MGMITKEYIDKVYTEMVGDYIKKGYHFYTKTMGGSQGEIAKVHLTNDIDIISILMYKKYAYDEDFIIVEVRKYDNFNTDILWNNKGECINALTFFYINVRGNKTLYFDSYEDYKAIKEKHWNRRTEHYNNRNNFRMKSVLNNERLSRLYHIAKTKKGYSTVKKSEIYGIGKDNYGYYIILNNGNKKIKIS